MHDSSVWEDISTAPFDRELELAVVQDNSLHTLVFACRRVLLLPAIGDPSVMRDRVRARREYQSQHDLGAIYPVVWRGRPCL